MSSPAPRPAGDSEFAADIPVDDRAGVPIDEVAPNSEARHWRPRVDVAEVAVSAARPQQGQALIVVIRVSTAVSGIYPYRHENWREVTCSGLHAASNAGTAVSGTAGSPRVLVARRAISAAATRKTLHASSAQRKPEASASDGEAWAARRCWCAGWRSRRRRRARVRRRAR